eukprot:CAMPEP_0195281338 /NCGR_PEP_ID=MMETSP0707-20130614/689_1 /TAXON_ID=33640 /ORGANISM="Asterionellopsis glacialis, Strain CCMP134" /LENGTH=1062 /DNA_ID=CAMNT_0040340213 /DNA_START=230 /DNA_END=3418 /DNA_ORIENTATION=-
MNGDEKKSQQSEDLIAGAAAGSSNAAGGGGGNGGGDWRIEALMDLLVDAGSEKTDSMKLESILVTQARLDFDDLPTQPQANDENALALIDQLQECMVTDAEPHQKAYKAALQTLENTSNPQQSLSSKERQKAERAAAKREKKAAKREKKEKKERAARERAEKEQHHQQQRSSAKLGKDGTKQKEATKGGNTSAALGAVYKDSAPPGQPAKEPPGQSRTYNSASKKNNSAAVAAAAAAKSANRQQQRAAAAGTPDANGNLKPPKPPEQPQQTSTFDDDEDSMSYPKIGPGYSDSISVVSDLTTPTVVTQMTVADEEHYDGHHNHGTSNHRNYIHDHLTNQNVQQHRHHTQDLPREPSISTLEAPGSKHSNGHRSRTESPAPPSAVIPPRDAGDPQPTSMTPNKNVKSQKHAVPEGRNNTSTPNTSNSGGGAAARRQQQHAAVFGKLAAGHHPSQQYKQTKQLQHTSVNKMAIPENTVSENTDYPSPTYFPSVFPQDDLSGSVPRSTKSGSRRSLLGHNSSSKRTMSSSQTKNTKRLGMRGIRRAKSASNAGSSSSSSSSSAAFPQQPYGTIQQQPPPPSQQQQRQQSRSNKIQSSKRQSSPAILSNNGTASSAKAKPPKMNNNNNNNDGNVDIDNVLSSMGQDIDYVFRELSALEEDGGGDSQQQQRRRPQQQRDMDDLEDELSVVSESNLGKTAKLKYTLGSVARSLRNDKNNSGAGANNNESGKKKSKDERELLSARKQEKANWGSLDSSGADNSNHQGSSVKSGEIDPLLIDSDGFIIGQGDESDPFAHAFSASSGAGGGSGHNGAGGAGSRSKSESSSFGSQDIYPTGAGTTAIKQPIPAVNNTKDAFDSFWNKQNKDSRQAQQEPSRQSSTRGMQQQQPVAIRPSSKKMQSQRRNASMEKPKPESTSRRTTTSGSGAIKPIPASKKETSSPRRSASLEERRRAAALAAAAAGNGAGPGPGPGPGGEPKKESRIDALEMETKQRIELLRKLVAERQQIPGHQQQQQHKQVQSALSSGKNHGGNDAALSNKLDFVEEETMKQIARLRQQQQRHREGGLEI